MKKTNFKKFHKLTTDRGYTATILRAETPHRLSEFNYQITISDIPARDPFVFYKTDGDQAIEAAKVWNFR